MQDLLEKKQVELGEGVSSSSTNQRAVSESPPYRVERLEVVQDAGVLVEQLPRKGGPRPELGYQDNQFWGVW